MFLFFSSIKIFNGVLIYLTFSLILSLILPYVHFCSSPSTAWLLYPLVSLGTGARHPCFAMVPLKAIGHGCLGPCCGGMCPLPAPCPVTVLSYLSNPDQRPSAQSSLSQPSLVHPWRQQQPSFTPPWQP